MSGKKTAAPVPPPTAAAEPLSPAAAEPLSPAAAERAQTRAAIASALRAVAAFVEAQPEHPNTPAMLQTLVKAHTGLIEVEARSEQDERIERVARPFLDHVVEIVRSEWVRLSGNASAPSTPPGAKAAA